MKISVIGLGRAGLPLASVIADSGFEVIGIDVDAKKCELINEGLNPTPEEIGLEDLLKKTWWKELESNHTLRGCDGLHHVHRDCAAIHR